MACNTCGKVSVKNDVNLKTSYEPNTVSKTKMTDIIMSFKIDKKKFYVRNIFLNFLIIFFYL